MAGETSIVVPVYNEEERLPALFAALRDGARTELERAGLSLGEALLVDDGSTDRTGELLRAEAERNPDLRICPGTGQNQGKGAAIRRGVENATGDFVLLVDADLSTPLSEAAKLASALRENKASIAIGSRNVAGATVEAPVHRRALGAGFNFGVRILTGLRYADTQCGFKLLEAGAAKELFREQISRGFAFDVELLLRADQAGYPVAEVPVIYLHDDRSRVRVATASVAMAWDVVRVAGRLRLGGRRAQAKRRPAGADLP